MNHLKQIAAKLADYQLDARILCHRFPRRGLCAHHAQ